MGDAGDAGAADASAPQETDSPTPPARPDEAAFTTFDAELQAFVDETDGVDGLGAIVVHRNWGVVHETVFRAFAPDRAYYVASSTKIMPAGVMMRLADQGLIDLDGPLGEHVDWAAHNARLLPWQLAGNSTELPGLLPGPGGTPYAKYLCQGYVYHRTGSWPLVAFLRYWAGLAFYPQAARESPPPDRGTSQTLRCQ